MIENIRALVDGILEIIATLRDPDAPPMRIAVELTIINEGNTDGVASN